jgi:hypothetical protein
MEHLRGWVISRQDAEHGAEEGQEEGRSKENWKAAA